MIELLSVMYGKSENLSPEGIQEFQKRIDDQIDADSLKLLEKHAEILRHVYPEIFGSETLAELLKRISLS